MPAKTPESAAPDDKVEQVARLMTTARWPDGSRLGVSPVQAIYLARLLQAAGLLKEGE